MQNTWYADCGENNTCADFHADNYAQEVKLKPPLNLHKPVAEKLLSRKIVKRLPTKSTPERNLE